MIQTIILGLIFGSVTHYQAPTTTPIQATVTAYSEIDSCHYENCVMASGKRAYVGAIACPRNIPLGAEVMIAGETYRCEDRTNLALDGRYDIFMGYGKESHRRAIEYGIQTNEISIRERY